MVAKATEIREEKKPFRVSRKDQRFTSSSCHAHARLFKVQMKELPAL